MLKEPQYKIASYGLYVNGSKSKQNGFHIETQPESGKVIGKVFISPIPLVPELNPAQIDSIENPSYFQDEEITVSLKM